MTPERQPASIPLKDRLGQQKWLTLIGLPILIYTTLTGIYSIWGLLFIYWGLMSARHGTVHLLEDIEQEENPVLFWLIELLWFGTGLLYIYADLYRFL